MPDAEHPAASFWTPERVEAVAWFIVGCVMLALLVLLAEAAS